MADGAMNTLASYVHSLSRMPLVRQLAFMVLLAAGIALGTAVVLWARTPAYSALYLDMSAQDSNEIVAALEQQGIDYRLAAGGMVTVPSGQVHRIRLQLANLGLPRDASLGYGMLDQEQSLGTSTFLERARYTRALEQELVKTIKLIRGIRDARIHLGIPRESSFLRNTRQPSASVMLDMMGGQTLNDTQLAGLVHLVTTSVSGLEMENVSVVDQRGNLLSRRQDAGINDGGEYLRFTRALEEDYQNRIIDILTPIVGAGNVRAQVSADVDYTLVETTQENFNPGDAAVRSEQTQEERTAATASPSPGELSATPQQATPLAAQNEAQNAAAESPATPPARTRINATRNYEIDRTVSHIRSAPGSVSRLSVAVLVDLHAGQEAGAANEQEATERAALDEERLGRFTQLVKDSIGFNEARGDSVNVINESFTAPESAGTPAGPGFWEQPWLGALIKQVLAGAVVLILIFAVLRPALSSVVKASPALPAPRYLAANPALSQQEEIEVGEDPVTFSQPGQTPLLANTPPKKSVFDQNLGLAQTLVEKEPVRATRMIKEWVAND